MTPAATTASANDDPGWPRRALGWLAILGFSVAGGALLLFRFEYGFETNDQFQYLLLPYRSIYQDFLRGDWLTWETSHYHLSFAWLIRGLHFLLGDKLPHGVFAVHGLTLVGIAFAVLQLARACRFSWFGAALALLITAFVREEVIAGALVNHGVLLPADMALPPFVLGLAAWIRGHQLRAGLWLGLAGLLHVNYAVVGPAVVAVPEIWRLVRERDWSSSARLAGGFLLVSWPALVMLLSSFLAGDTAPEGLEILYKVRSPHHYDPALLNSDGLWWTVALLVAGIPYWLGRRASATGRRLVAAVAALVALQVIAGLATWLELGGLIRIFLWRLSAPLALIAQVVLGESLWRGIRDRRLTQLLCTTAGLLAVVAFAAGGKIELTPQIDLRGYGVLLPILAPLAAAAALAARNPSRRVLRWGALVAGGAVLASTLAFSVPGLLLDESRVVHWSKVVDEVKRFDVPQIGPRRFRRNARLYRWIRRQLPADAVLLTPPGIIDFRLGARRGIFVDWKGCPMKGHELIEWRRRMFAVMGADRFPAVGWKLSGVAQRRYLRRPLGQLARLAREEGIEFVVARRGSDAKARESGMKLRLNAGRLAVYQLLPTTAIE